MSCSCFDRTGIDAVCSCVPNNANASSTVTIILIITFGIHACPNRVFAEVQYATSVLKVVVLLIFIFTSAAMVGGAGPTGKVHDGEYWRDLPAFLHNVKVCLTIPHVQMRVR